MPGTRGPTTGSRPRILIAEPEGFDGEARAILAACGDVEDRAVSTDELTLAFRSYDAILVRLGHRIDDEVVGTDPRCRVLGVPTTGLDHLDLEACRRAGVAVVSLRGETAFLREIRATAEHTLLLMLALLRHLPGAVASVRAGEWDRDRFKGRELYGRRAGIVGVGRLGEIVGSYLQAMGMEVCGYDPDPGFRERTSIRPVDTLAELVAEVDVISVHATFESGQEPILGEAELEHVRPGTILVNTARGGLLDEAAVVAALRAGRLAGVAVDVLADEPSVESSPLARYAREHDNVIITPHLGGNTVESTARTERFIATRVVEALGARA